MSSATFVGAPDMMFTISGPLSVTATTIPKVCSLRTGHLVSSPSCLIQSNIIFEDLGLPCAIRVDRFCWMFAQRAVTLPHPQVRRTGAVRTTLSSLLSNGSCGIIITIILRLQVRLLNHLDCDSLQTNQWRFQPHQWIGWLVGWLGRRFFPVRKKPRLSAQTPYRAGQNMF